MEFNAKELSSDIEAVFKKHFPEACGGERPALVVAFTLPYDYSEAHWFTNMDRMDALKVLRLASEKMQIRSN